MNMLRVWGGGIYETEDFYRACDRRGIMVWQDFPFACAMYPEGKWFVDNVRREAQQAIKGLRNHPSLVLWCGNNENHWAAHSWWPGAPFGGKKIYDRVLPALVRDLDPSRPYWPGSPWGGRDPNCEARGDRHSWDVWSGWGDYRNRSRSSGRSGNYIRNIRSSSTTTSRSAARKDLPASSPRSFRRRVISRSSFT
jgi:beta-mannosidase